MITTSEISVALTIDHIDAQNEHEHHFLGNRQLLGELEKIAEIIIEKELTLIAIIGRGLTIPGTIQDIFDITSEDSIKLACYGASSSSISLLVPEADDLAIARKLHRALI